MSFERSLTAEELKELAEPNALNEAALNMLYTMSFDILQRILILEICKLKGYSILELPPEKEYA